MGRGRFPSPQVEVDVGEGRGRVVGDWNPLRDSESTKTQGCRPRPPITKDDGGSQRPSYFTQTTHYESCPGDSNTVRPMIMRIMVM